MLVFWLGGVGFVGVGWRVGRVMVVGGGGVGVGEEVGEGTEGVDMDMDMKWGWGGGLLLCSFEVDVVERRLVCGVGRVCMVSISFLFFSFSLFSIPIHSQFPFLSLSLFLSLVHRYRYNILGFPSCSYACTMHDVNVLENCIFYPGV